MGWFAVGSIWNVRKGKAILRWMQGGLPLSRRAHDRPLARHDSVEMVIQKAKHPFEQVTLVIFLEPRDVPWIWGLSRARGRRDTLIVRARLGRAPLRTSRSLDRGELVGARRAPRMASEQWSVREPAGQEPLPVFYKSERAVALADDRSSTSARHAGLTVRRLSVRRVEPHFQLHVDLPADCHAPPRSSSRRSAPSGERAGPFLGAPPKRASGPRRHLAVLPVSLQPVPADEERGDDAGARTTMIIAQAPATGSPLIFGLDAIVT